LLQEEKEGETSLGFGVDKKIILNVGLRKWMSGCELGFTGPGEGWMECGNLRTCSLKAGIVMATLATVKFLIRSVTLSLSLYLSLYLSLSLSLSHTQSSLFCSIFFLFASPMS
jgi:hypothetical protein